MRPSKTVDNKRIVSALDRVDWDFPRAGTWTNALHSLHWFPGNFIPQIPSYLIELLSQEGDIVFDPFAGNCTTGVEALMLNRTAWISDFSPVSHLISRAKLELLTNQAAREDLASVQLPPFLSNSAPIANNERMDHQLREWFHPDTLDQLSRVWGLVIQPENCRVRAALEMIFSDTLFACASTLRSLTASGKPRRHHWGWVADNVLPKPPIWHDAVKYFEERLYRAKQITSHLPAYHATFDVRREDIRLCSYDSNAVDLVVTSPPYLGMIDYTMANRLTYLWQGWNLIADRSIEIGARSRRNAVMASTRYLADIEKSVAEVHRVLRRGGVCAIVIGSSRKYPDMASQVIGVFERRLELIWGPKERVPSRRRLSNRQGKPTTEYICVLKKD